MSYRDFIKSLPCSVCEDDTTVQQHHLIELELVEKGMALKVPEILSIPLCKVHHDMVHLKMHQFEICHGDQVAHLAKTLLKAHIAGVKDYE